MVGFALIVTRVQATSAVILVFGCSLVLGFGANAIVASGMREYVVRHVIRTPGSPPLHQPTEILSQQC